MIAKYKVGEIVTLKPGVFIPVDIQKHLIHGQLDDFTDAIIEDVLEYNCFVTEYFIKVLDGKFADRIACVSETNMIARADYLDEDIDVIDMSELL